MPKIQVSESLPEDDIDSPGVEVEALAITNSPSQTYQDDEEAVTIGKPNSEEAILPKKIGSDAPASPATAVESKSNIIGLVSFVLLVAQNSAAVLIMRYTLTKPYERQYLTSTAVIMAEAMKTCLSMLIVLYQNKTLRTTFSDPLDVLKTSIPALLYLVQNNLQYVAVRYMHAATYQVVYQIKLLTTAICWTIVFRTCISKLKWMALVVLFLGVVCVRLSEAKADATPSESLNLTKGLTATMLATLTSAAAGIYFEILLKGKSKLSVWQRNFQMGAYSMLFGIVGLFVTGAWAEVEKNGFFHGYTNITMLSITIQGFGGLLIGVLIKYTNVILKDMSTALSVTVSCFLSWWLLGQPISALFILGAIFASAGVFIYTKSR